MNNSLDSLRDRERKKYDILYKDDTEYGSFNHGKNKLDLLVSLKPDSVIDVGCGDNALVEDLNKMGISGFGVDISSPDADIKAPAHSLPVKDQTYGYVTAFDVLEHLLPEEIDEVFREFKRVAKIGFMFTISLRKSKKKVDPDTGKITRIPNLIFKQHHDILNIEEEFALHQTIRTEEWWVSKINTVADINYLENHKNFNLFVHGVFKKDMS